MMNAIFMEQFARSHHRELLEKAESCRKVTQAIGKKSNRIGTFRRIMRDVGKLAVAPANLANAYLTHES